MKVKDRYKNLTGTEVLLHKKGEDDAPFHTYNVSTTPTVIVSYSNLKVAKRYVGMYEINKVKDKL